MLDNSAQPSRSTSASGALLLRTLHDSEPAMSAPPKLLYLYLGRRGAMPKFTLELVRAPHPGGVAAPVAIAQDNALAADFDALPNAVVKLRLFGNAAGAWLEIGRLGALRRELGRFIDAHSPDAVVELMPHVWSPFLEDVPMRHGAKRVAILHDWRSHPGDHYGVVNGWLTRSALRADHIVTLSRSVADDIIAGGAAPPDRVTALFHPDTGALQEPLRAGGPLRVLFFGRLLPYKGLDLCVEAIARARASGAAIELCVAGQGDIGSLRSALERIGATVCNYWLDDEQIGRMLADCHVVAATHREASQSGVIAAALGAGRPVIATPVGSLPEQVVHGKTGLVAAEVSAEAIADVLLRLADDRSLLERLASNVVAEAPARSMQAFARALTEAVSPLVRA